MNFGVLEVANSKAAAAAPGWAYVADTGANTSVTALQPRKRARNQPAASLHETTAKQDAKILRELAALDRENHKDVSIPIPPRHKDNSGRAIHNKGTTPAVRKILLSQKTFLNHLDDFVALGPAATTVPAAPTPNIPAVRSTATASTNLTSKGTRSHKKKDTNTTPLRRVSAASKQTSTPLNTIKPDPDTDTPMSNTSPNPAAAQTILSTSTNLPAPHPRDKDPLLISHIPSLPSQAEIEKLLTAPPLSYNEARGAWLEEDRRKPPRAFCEVCGYWGRVRCMRCGGKVCALECLGVHQEECFNKYAG